MRTCIDTNSCGTTTSKPQESQTCTPKTISGFTNIGVLDVDYAANGTLKLWVEDRVGDTISITSVSVNGLQIPSMNVPMNLFPLERVWLTGTNTMGVNGHVGDPYTLAVTMTYLDSGSNGFSVTGTVSGERS
ncbi:MAG: hypothetical protein V1887_02105 [Candidatus Aenigmatarchaeota archaeon]